MQLKAHLKELGISGLMLCVANDNEKGINFYRKYGFTELENSSMRQRWESAFREQEEK